MNAKSIKIIVLVIVGIIGISLIARAKINTARATFAGGCFWCMEYPFEQLKGVISVTSGYSGGHTVNPTYREVSAGNTGHYEVVQIVYNPRLISYEDLINVFWKNIDPTDAYGQFVDKGSQYLTAVFTHNKQQKKIALSTRQKLADSGKFDRPIVTRILSAKRFYPAEEYHQDFYKKSPLRYKSYSSASGREEFILENWGAKEMEVNKYSKPSQKVIKQKLTPLQYKVTQQEGTERPFQNEYWDNKREGIYVDVVSGEPLFSSKDKYKSGSGWPSFTRPLDSKYIIERVDKKLLSTRTEVRSKQGDSHLGHVFNDGPLPTGFRYCINSAALRFIPVADLQKEGYGEYLKDFK